MHEYLCIKSNFYFFIMVSSGGGKDLATAVNFSKNITLSATNNVISNPLKSIIPAESVLKTFLPKVNTASTRIPATISNTSINNSMTPKYTNYLNTGNSAVYDPSNQNHMPQGI